MLIETDANLVTQAHYTDLPGEWGGLASERRGSTSSFYGFDQQSNTRILVSIGGNITDSYLYKAFGEELLVSGTTVNPLRFGGQVGYYRDFASRLYVEARVLRVDLGRWIGKGQIWNEELSFTYPHIYVSIFTYAGNNPLSEVTGDCGNYQCPTKQNHRLQWFWGTASCYGNDFKNCCTACQTCFNPCAATAAALPLGRLKPPKGPGWQCGDVVKCCRHIKGHLKCITVTITDTGSESGRLIDFGCCYAINTGFFPDATVRSVKCATIGSSAVPHGCKNACDCAKKRSQRGVECGGTIK